MQFYPAGETIARGSLDLPLQRTEWIITGAQADEIIAAGFRQHARDETRFVHPDSGDVYQLARLQYYDEAGGELKYRCGRDVTLEDELATRPLTILAMAGDGDQIIDPFGGQDDLDAGVLRHVTPLYVCQPLNLLLTAVWAARLRGWGFKVAHSTFGLMKKMVRSGVLEGLPQKAVQDAVLQAMASPRPSEFFRVLHRCRALAAISEELAGLFAGPGQSHGDTGLPEVMRALDRAAVGTDNVTTVIKRFYRLLGDKADDVFTALGLAALLEGSATDGD